MATATEESGGNVKPLDAPNGEKPRRPASRRLPAKLGISARRLKSPAFHRQYPFASRFHDIEGHAYHYLDEGEGEPVVMVHGNPTWSFFYRNLVLGLRDSHRCLVPDHMGMGFSDKPQKYPYTLERHIRNLENWLEAVLPPPAWNGGRINLVVHDWGGPIGFGYAIRHPARIKRLVVLNSSIFTAGDMPRRIKMCRWPIVGEHMIRRLNIFARLAATSTTVTPLAKEIRKLFVMPYNSWKNRVGVDAFVKDIPLDAGTPTHALLRRIEETAPDVFGATPLLVQWGMKDWCFTPVFLELWRNAFPRAEVDEYEAGHYLLEDSGGAILARMRSFLERPAP